MHDLDNDDSPWDDAPTATPSHADAEWAKLSSNFQNAGYRDGITEGKEAALQEGFDAGFAQAGAPRGRELGLLRGLAGALLLHLTRAAAAATATAVHPSAAERSSASAAPAAHTAPHVRAHVRAVREIVDALATVRFADIAPSPPPEEAEHLHAHATGNEARKSRGNNDEQNGGGGGGEKGEEEELVSGSLTTAMTIEDVRALRIKLEAVLREAAIKVDVNLESFDP
ncbi:hypothetical protein BC827DRAFT_1268552 [Russula dissimulans]|nr:hypothetical protein BC827DRAFT_1268552 [Russula dissimulans]